MQYSDVIRVINTCFNDKIVKFHIYLKIKPIKLIILTIFALKNR